jgi:hypothetical protein
MATLLLAVLLLGPLDAACSRATVRGGRTDDRGHAQDVELDTSWSVEEAERESAPREAVGAR